MVGSCFLDQVTFLSKSNLIIVANAYYLRTIVGIIGFAGDYFKIYFVLSAAIFPAE